MDWRLSPPRFALAQQAGSALAAPEATVVTPALVEAAKKEGKVSFYTAVDVEVAEKVAAAFKAKYPGIDVLVERSGSERIFQRVGQEYSSSIYNADVVNSSDGAHYIVWKRDGWLAPYVPEDVAKYYGANSDPDGLYAIWRATLSPIGINTKYVKPADAPRSFADLLDPKWKGLIVKAHPGYSGTILTATYEISRDLGWDYLRKLGTQKVMQVQSSTEPPKKLALGERPVMADGNEYNMFILKDQGKPVEVVYPSEGTPFITSPSAVMAKAPHPNAARLFQSFLFTAEDAAAADRRGRSALAPPGHQGACRPHAAQGHQADEGRSGRGRRQGGGDQVELREVFRHVKMSVGPEVVGRVSALAGEGAPSSRQPVARPAVRRPDAGALVSAGFALLLVLLVGLPVGWLALYAVTDKDGAFTLANFVRLFTDETFLAPVRVTPDRRDLRRARLDRNRCAGRLGRGALRHAGPGASCGR